MCVCVCACACVQLRAECAVFKSAYFTHTGQWLYDSPLHYLQLWLEVQYIHVHVCIYSVYIVHIVYIPQHLSTCTYVYTVYIG